MTSAHPGPLLRHGREGNHQIQEPQNIRITSLGLQRINTAEPQNQLYCSFLFLTKIYFDRSETLFHRFDRELILDLRLQATSCAVRFRHFRDNSHSRFGDRATLRNLNWFFYKEWEESIRA